MVPLSSAVHMDGSRPHLRGSLNALELGALAPVRPPFPKVVQALLGKGGWNQGSVRVSSVTCGFYDQTSWYLCCAMVERLRFSNWKKKWPTCALSNWSLSISHVHTRVPVRPVKIPAAALWIIYSSRPVERQRLPPVRSHWHDCFANSRLGDKERFTRFLWGYLSLLCSE